MLGSRVTVTVDRPMGSHHPRYDNIVYPCNYGYVKGMMAGDGSEQDAYVIGINYPLTEFSGIVVAVVHRKNDVEDKWIVAPEEMFFTHEEIQARVHFVEQYFVTEFEFLD
jgi:inorganic pyrophosphatase